jgi:hypothetical protein
MRSCVCGVLALKSKLSRMNEALHQRRVTKYNPAHRDPSGAYQLDEWTSHADVGKSFNGVQLTEDDYLAVEQAYVDVAMAFLKESQLTELTVRGLEHSAQLPFTVEEGQSVPACHLPDIVRALLREQFWCRLEGPTAFIHVGWDYYMYVGTPAPCKGAEALAPTVGLFVEPFRSPYAANEASTFTQPKR